MKKENENEICRQCDEFCEMDKKRRRFGKYKQINDILLNCYQKCCASKFYPCGIFLKEEALEIKKRLNNDDFEAFTASDSWLTRWKLNYYVKDRIVCGEAGDVSVKTVTSWMEHIGELVKGYEPENIWNMDESGLFFKALPEIDLPLKGKESKGGKKSKQQFTIANSLFRQFS